MMFDLIIYYIHDCNFWSNNFEDISIASRKFSTMELNDSSPSSKGKKSVKMNNTGKLNEKYAMMQVI